MHLTKKMFEFASRSLSSLVLGLLIVPTVSVLLYVSMRSKSLVSTVGILHYISLQPRSHVSGFDT